MWETWPDVRKWRRQGTVPGAGQATCGNSRLPEFERLTPGTPRAPFVEFMESLYLDGLDLHREVDRGRDVEL